MKAFAKLLLLLCCLVTLLISLQIFWNQGVVADELGLGAGQLYGGQLWLYLAWLRFPLLLIATVIALAGLFPKKQ